MYCSYKIMKNFTAKELIFWQAFYANAKYAANSFEFHYNADS